MLSQKDANRDFWCFPRIDQFQLSEEVCLPPYKSTQIRKKDQSSVTAKMRGELAPPVFLILIEPVVHMFGPNFTFVIYNSREKASIAKFVLESEFPLTLCCWRLIMQFFNVRSTTPISVCSGSHVDESDASAFEGPSPSSNSTLLGHLLRVRSQRGEIQLRVRALRRRSSQGPVCGRGHCSHA